MNTISFEKKNAKMVAHRGVSGLEKENTLPAFVAAGNRSYFGIETDVHVTADGKFVVIHDDDTARVGIDDLSVEGSTFDTLRSLCLTDIDGKRGRIDLRIPTLEEYILTCKRYEKVAVLELKNRIRDEDIARIVEDIRALGWLGQVIFISFELENMKTLRRLLPEQKLQYLTEYIDEELIDILKKENLDLDIWYKALTAEWVQKLHAAGKEVNVWTPNEAQEGDTLAAWGVDYITSNILE